MANFELKKTYSFDIYPKNYFENDFDNVTVVGVFDYSTAVKFADIDTIHAAIRNSVPHIPDSPNDYTYIQFEGKSGNRVILGTPWIKNDTIKNIDSKKIIIEVSDVSADNIKDISAALSQNGFDNFKIRTE